MDFTLSTYKQLLEMLNSSGFSFQTVESFIQSPEKKVVVLRHDVDERPGNALRLAQIEFDLGIQATYYFRILKISNDPEVISKITAMGHEIGYHYEDYASANGDLTKAIDSFKKNLDYFRKFYPVKTVCMHGSSMSSYDNKTMWDHYSLSDFDLIGEPYISIDYANVFYLTDTGRFWDGGRYSVRDSVQNSFHVSCHKTSDIITAAQNGELPDTILLQSHTLWTDSIKEWFWLEIREKARNNLKMIIVKMPILKKMAYKVIQKYSK
jgi:hypothetical protein